MWRIALKSLVADRGRLLTSLTGVVFAVVLVNVQVGMLLGFLQKTSLLIDHGQADIWVGHRHMSNVDMSSFIQERWLARIRAVDGVERADPYLLVTAEARMPDGRFKPIQLLGCDPASPLGQAWTSAAGDDSLRAIRHPDGIIVDRCDAAKLGDCRIGDCREINGHRARVVGMSHGVVGFTSAPYVFTSLDRARSKYGAGLVPPGGCSYFLVKARPGSDLPSLAARIQQRVPELAVHDRAAYSRMCASHWLCETGIGFGVGLTTLLGLVVGLGVVAQTLYSSVTERLREYAMLKALGAADHCVTRFLVAQSLGNALCGSLLGLALAHLLGWVLTSPQAPLVVEWPISLLSVALVTLVCFLAAWLPYGRVRRIDPASVLRG